MKYGQEAIREEIAELERKRDSLARAEFSPGHLWRTGHEAAFQTRKDKARALRELDKQIEKLKTYLR